MYKTFREQIISFLKEKDEEQQVAIWGASVRGIIAGTILNELGYKEYIYIDSDITKQGKSLEGHAIIDFSQVKNSKVYIIVSMEYQSTVVDLLEKCGFVRGKKFGSLKAFSDKALVDKVNSKKDNIILVLGASSIHIVPMKDVQQEDLSEILEMRYGEKIKVLGSSCLGMRNMYYLLCVEIMQNIKLKQVVILLSWETLTSFHHKLPRTQKPELLRLLSDYVRENGENALADTLEQECKVALDRSTDYEFENQHSPKRLDNEYDEKFHVDLLKEYFDMSIMQPLDVNCEEIQYLIKIMKLTERKDIKCKLIIEPVNIELCRILGGERFNKIYSEKCRGIKMLAEQHSALFWDASSLLKTDAFSSINVVNEAIYSEGRRIFSEYIYSVIEEDAEI